MFAILRESELSNAMEETAARVTNCEDTFIAPHTDPFFILPIVQGREIFGFKNTIALTTTQSDPTKDGGIRNCFKI